MLREARAALAYRKRCADGIARVIVDMPLVAGLAAHNKVGVIAFAANSGAVSGSTGGTGVSFTGPCESLSDPTCKPTSNPVGPTVTQCYKIL